MSASSTSTEDCFDSSIASLGVLQEVRTSRVKEAFGPGMAHSAYFKQPVQGRVKVTTLGCEGDEHAFIYHGGPDMALLQYCSSHYADWKDELPTGPKELVGFGAFGENLVVAGLTEEDVCLGDVIRIGPEVVASPCQPRQPCYKLNHRFKYKDMSQRSQDSGRTGWLYKILREGTIGAGDEMVLVARPNPNWSIRRVQQYLYHDKNNEVAMTELADMETLAPYMRNLFKNRLQKNFEVMEARLLGGEEEFKDAWSDYTVTSKTFETSRILSLVLEAKEPVDTPKFAIPGSHIRIKLGGDLVRAYSVISGDQNRLELGVASSDTSRGGSKFIHEALKINDTFSISEISTSFPLHEAADKHIFVAGGIGITAFIPAIKECEAKEMPYYLHYLVRNTADVAFSRYLDPCKDNITIHDKSVGNTFDAATILRKADSLTHIYTCGSTRLMDAVKSAAKTCGIADANVHFEAFAVDATGDPFTACLQRSKKTLKVGAKQSLLDVLREAGLDIGSSCEVGNCGTCRVGLLSGRVEHRGSGMEEFEKVNGLLSCVSRGVGEIVLDI